MGFEGLDGIASDLGRQTAQEFRHGFSISLLEGLGDGGDHGGDGGDLGLPQAWIQAVRDVLPGVPFSTIIRDLTKTRSVNRTVNNLLEGAG